MACIELLDRQEYGSVTETTSITLNNVFKYEYLLAIIGDWAGTRKNRTEWSSAVWLDQGEEIGYSIYNATSSCMTRTYKILVTANSMTLTGEMYHYQIFGVSGYNIDLISALTAEGKSENLITSFPLINISKYSQILFVNDSQYGASASESTIRDEDYINEGMEIGASGGQATPSHISITTKIPVTSDSMTLTGRMYYYQVFGLSKPVTNKYCYTGLIWLADGEDIDVVDKTTDKMLINSYTLSDYKDTIELPSPPGAYDTYSAYYMRGNGVYTNISGRDFAKTNVGDGYAIAAYDGNATGPMLLSMSRDCVATNNPSFEHSFTYDGNTWWTGGNQYGFTGNFYEVPHFMGLDMYGPYSTDLSDNYKLPCIQKATAALNVIYQKYIPIPGKYASTSPYYMEESGEFALLYYYSRTYYKLNEGPAYAFCCYDGTDTHAILISMTENNVAWTVNNYTPPSPTKFTVTYGYCTWYVSGFGYSEPGNYSTSSAHYIDISSGAPYSSLSDIALALLQTIYGY